MKRENDEYIYIYVLPLQTLNKINAKEKPDRTMTTMNGKNIQWKINCVCYWH